MNPETLEAALASHFQGHQPLDHWEWGNIEGKLNRYGHSVPVQTDYHVAVVEKNEHTEGNWRTNLYIILAVRAPDGSVQFFRKTGYYASHDGEYWDGPLVEVFPETVTTTVWSDDLSEGYTENSYDDSYGSY